MAIGTAALIVGAASAAANVAGAGQRAGEAENQQNLALRLARATPRELQEIEANTTRSLQTIERERKLIEAVDPAIAEAGKQAYSLMRGQEAAILGPLNRQRSRMKDSLRDTLRKQLGPGFETSSAGIEAMNRFDTETSDITTQAQQQAISGLLGQALQGRQLAQTSEATAQQQAFQSVTALGNIQGRQVNAATGTAGAKVNAAGGVARELGGAFQSFGQLAAAGNSFQAAGGGGGSRLTDQPLTFGQADFSSMSDILRPKPASFGATGDFTRLSRNAG